LVNSNGNVCTLIDPNFSISKLIVLNSNESAQKQPQNQQPPPAVNLSFTSDNLINFGDATDADATTVGTVGNQVCVDATNGQLTFPMFLSNEGLFSHLPFLVNNEWLAQQLRSDMFTTNNGDVSHIEIPLPEPITVTANQLPPNSRIINSAVKQTIQEEKQLKATQSTQSAPAEAPQLERSGSKLPSGNPVPASLDSSRLVLERVTPSTSGIVNVKAFRSLSTPRKRTSHVRTLNFSPKAVTQLQNTPVSTRRQQRRVKLKTVKEKQSEEMEEKPMPGEAQPEKPFIIKNVEILPKFGSSPSKEVVGEAVTEAGAAGVAATAAGGGAAVGGGSADLSANESNSNSCVPPLFAMEEGSNQTVIKAATKTTVPAPAPVPAANVAATPKRKQKRRAAAKACKRIISQAVDELQVEEHKQQQEQELDTCASTSHDDSKENQSESTAKEQQQAEQEEEEDLMAAWQRQMHGSNVDLEQRLREINAN